MGGELAKAVCQVMKAVRYVPETGENKFHKYKYASDEDLLTVIQPAMAENGLALIPSHVDRSTVPHTPDAKGKPQWRTDLTVTYQLIHISGESMPVEVPGCGLDGEDKGVYKGMTGVLKYALRHLFLVPTGQDPERGRDQDRDRDDDREPNRDSDRGRERARDERPKRSEWDPSVWDNALKAKGGLTLDECVWWATTKSQERTHPEDMPDDMRARALAFFCGDQGIERVRGDVFEVRGELQRAFFTKWSVEFPEPRKKDGVSDEDRQRAIANSEDNRRRVMRRWYGVESVKQVSIRDALKGDFCIGWLREVKQNDFAAAVDEALGAADDGPRFPDRAPPEGTRTAEPLVRQLRGDRGDPDPHAAGDDPNGHDLDHIPF